MLHKTQGIVFRFIKYKESSIIVHIFTEKFGLRSYIVNGVRSKSSKGKIALFQPLTCLDLVVYHKESGDIQRISELKCTHPFQTIPIEIKKSSIVLFLTEILYKTIKEQHDVEALFTFIQQSILVLDNLTTNFENFHLQFLLKLTRYLGFGIADNNELSSFLFDKPDDYGFLKILHNTTFDQHLQLINSKRKNLLDIILNYYRQHYPNLGEIKSLAVLSEVLH